MQRTGIFDMPHYRVLDDARISLFRELLPECQEKLEIRTALDLGCGLGKFSAVLSELGLSPVAVDGRSANVEEARRRYPEVRFQVSDVEDPSVQGLGAFDLVLCLGLLYHLENPLRALRNMCKLTSRLLLVESMCTDEKSPVLHLRDEGPTEDQGLRHVAFYPSEAYLVKMLYRSGFSSVYRFTRLPAHADFQRSRSRRRVRTLLAASFAAIDLPFLRLVAEPGGLADPWATHWTTFWALSRRIVHFAAKPWSVKIATLRRHLS